MRRLLALLLILTAVVTAAAGEEDVEIEELLRSRWRMIMIPSGPFQ